MLFVHGDDGRNVPFQQTTDVAEKLRAQNVAFEELIIPDEIHDLLRWSDWIRAYRGIAEFDRKMSASGERQQAHSGDALGTLRSSPVRFRVQPIANLDRPFIMP